MPSFIRRYELLKIVIMYKKELKKINRFVILTYLC